MRFNVIKKWCIIWSNTIGHKRPLLTIAHILFYTSIIYIINLINIFILIKYYLVIHFLCFILIKNNIMYPRWALRYIKEQLWMDNKIVDTIDFIYNNYMKNLFNFFLFCRNYKPMSKEFKTTIRTANMMAYMVINCIVTIKFFILYIFVLNFFLKKFIHILINYISIAPILNIIMNNFFTELTIIPLSISILILNSIFIFIFKKWIGVIGVFYNSIFSLIIYIILNIYLLSLNVKTNTFIYMDLGRWFFTNDLIDSHIILCFDNLTIILSIIVSVLTILAQFFGIEYMSREAFVSRLLYLLNLFATSVILLFCVYDFFLILIAWECIGLFSFLLVNYYSTRIYTLKASLKTFIFSRISDMFIFISFNICILLFNTTDLTIIFCKIPFFIFHSFYINNISINCIFILTFTLSLASCIKGAQFFFHVWLPDAMEAPTPASALIHSSTLVIMGIYLIIRFGIIFEFTLVTNYFLIIIGGLTIAFGSVIASFQLDIKKLVAYSTISQMGYLICGCGFCAYDETIIYLIMHACNKALLFILVGYTVHFFSGNTDLRQMGGLYLYAFDVSILFLFISLNLIGLPYGTGFFSKEFILFQILQDNFLVYFVRGMWFISFCFTPYYMFLLCTSVTFNNKKFLKIILVNVFKNIYTLQKWSPKKIYNYKLNKKSKPKSKKYFIKKTKLYRKLLPSIYNNSLAWSTFSSILFVFSFLMFNIIGDFLTFIIFNLSTSMQFNFIENFLTLKVYNIFLLTTNSNFIIESLFIFVIIGLYLSLTFLINFNITNIKLLHIFNKFLKFNLYFLITLIVFFI